RISVLSSELQPEDHLHKKLACSDAAGQALGASYLPKSLRVEEVHHRVWGREEVTLERIVNIKAQRTLQAFPDRKFLGGRHFVPEDTGSVDNVTTRLARCEG